MYYWIKRRNEETKEKDRKGKNNESKESRNRKGVSERNPVEWWDRECVKAIKLRKKV